MSNGFQVVVTTAEGNATTYKTERLPEDKTRRTVTRPDGKMITSTVDAQGARTTVWPDNTKLVVEQKPDKLFGLATPLPKTTLTLPTSQKAVAVELTRSVDGSDISETVTVTGDSLALSRSLFVQPTASPPAATFTSAGNRKVKLTFDDKGRVLEAELDPPSTDLAKVSVQYDNQGRVDKVTQGTRELKLDYANASGFLTKVTQSSTSSSDTRVIEYKQHDGVGRPRTVTLPGAHDLGLLYDGNGNMTSVTPPGKSAHGLEPTDVDLLWKHTSPVVGGSAATSQWDYDKDRRPWKFTRADSATPLEAVWDPNHTDRLLRVETADGNYTPEYDPATGALKKWTSPGGIVTEAGLDGPRLTGMSTTWPGPVVGSVSWTPDALLRVAGETVTGGSAVTVTEFDPDGKIKTAEVANTTCSVGFVASTGWTKSLTVGNVFIDMARHPSHGEVSSITAKLNGSPFYTATYPRPRWAGQDHGQDGGPRDGQNVYLRRGGQVVDGRRQHVRVRRQRQPHQDQRRGQGELRRA